MFVSVIVATYNCASYIEDALNSVWRQTYKNIELVVTDDCSSDDSVKVTEKWIAEHKDRFVRVAQTRTTQNSGVTANYNTGLNEARGEWVKCLDGDDMLTDNAIETYVKNVKQMPTKAIWYANEQVFDNNGSLGNTNRTVLPKTTARKQMIFLLKHRLLGICTATNFIQRETFVLQGGFDSHYPMYQDGSPFLQSLAEGKEVGVIDCVTLFKRENPNSLMHTDNPVMVKNIRDCHYCYSHYYLRYCMPLHFYNAWVTYYLSTHNMSRWYEKTTGYLLRCFDLVNIYRKICSSQL